MVIVSQSDRKRWDRQEQMGVQISLKGTIYPCLISFNVCMRLFERLACASQLRTSTLFPALLEMLANRSAPTPGHPWAGQRCCSGRGMPPSAAWSTHRTHAEGCSTSLAQGRWLHQWSVKRGRESGQWGVGGKFQGQAYSQCLAWLTAVTPTWSK